MSLLLRLKTETRSHHECTEASVRLLEPGLTADDYRRHLEAVLGFQAPVEAPLTEVLDAALPALRMRERRKVPLLEQDLRALGHDAASLSRLPRCARRPSVSELPEALGCAYVLEGSTLGGQLILRHLRRHFGERAPGGFAYFQAHGEEVGARWRAFGEALLQASADAASTDFDARVVLAAQDTFDCFGAWLRESRGT
ncbi:biliverdin-producing heme oxygenase [Myxococcus sp. K15C18031901]|uniref:biliverdin-producing heme oxygenase n=1 Tax=Myxococcus dinghuensis TaxID=2906761 RepID=UPI0020A78237|nr:biliverdin-producing heme oxygenase [Myxococcus dinghuensis]MCP3103111.1 biliverdin-producing heme oxygenase [Myxococcus dinghuensis]